MPNSGYIEQCAAVPNAASHDLQRLTKTWQTMGKTLVVGTSREKVFTLSHSREILVCLRCGFVFDPLMKASE